MLIRNLTAADMDVISALRNIPAFDVPTNRVGEMADNNYFLRFWDAAKSEFLSDVFKDGLILKKRICTSLDPEDVLERAQRMIWNNPNFEQFFDTLSLAISESNSNNWLKYDYYVPAKAFTDPEVAMQFSTNQWNMHYCVRTLLSATSLATNVYKGADCEIALPSGSTFKLSFGAKASKAIGRLAKAFSLADAWEPLRLEHSRLLNEVKFNATMCLSIHPADYMTASFNDNDWRSCMNWEDGEYRRGVIEMMNSPYVVVAYLESDSSELYINHNITWNSKKWREFFIVNEDLISGIKGYPYWNRGLEREAIEWLRSLVEATGKAKYADHITSWAVDSYVDDEVAPGLSLSFSCGPAMYNDFYDGNMYQTCFNLTSLRDQLKYSLHYSGASECVYCGETENEFDDEGALVCNECFDVLRCCTCGDKINDDDAYELSDGSIYCAYCYYNLPSCFMCEEKCDPEIDPEVMKFGIGTTSREYMRRNGNPNTDYPEVFVACSCCRSSLFKGEPKILGRCSTWHETIKLIDPHSFTEEALDAATGIKDPEEICEEIKKQNEDAQRISSYSRYTW